MLRLYISGSGCFVCGILGSLLTLAILAVIYVADPHHMRQLDAYPADPDSISIPAPPPTNTTPLDAPPPQSP